MSSKSRKNGRRPAPRSNAPARRHSPAPNTPRDKKRADSPTPAAAAAPTAPTAPTAATAPKAAPAAAAVARPVDPALEARKHALLGAGIATLARWSGRLLLITGAAIALLWLVSKAWVVLFPAFIGLMIATLLEPVVRRLRPRTGDAAAAAITLLGSLGAVVGMCAVLAPQVAGQIGPLSRNVAAGIEDLRKLAAGKPFYLEDSQIGDTLAQVSAEIQSHALSIGTGVWSGVMSVGSIVLNVVLALVLGFFILKDGHRFLPWLSSILGTKAAPHISAVGGRLWDGIAGFVRAQALVGLVDGVLIGIGLALLGVPLAVPLAVLIFFGSFIPIFGALLTGVAAALVALVTVGPGTALAVVGIVVAVNQIEGNVLAPMLLGKSLALHPAVIMGSVTIGGATSGIMGAFLAVPIAAAVASCFRYLVDQLDNPSSADACETADPDGTAAAVGMGA